MSRHAAAWAALRAAPVPEAAFPLDDDSNVLASPGHMDRMEAFVELAFPVLARTGVSWLGFYLDLPDQPEETRLVLGSHRDRPACSPIGTHGVCGQALLRNEARVVEDVRTLGTAYVACDPKDRSEVVVPCRRARGLPWGVLDLDSREVGAFTAADAAELTALLERWGLSRGGPAAGGKAGARR